MRIINEIGWAHKVGGARKVAVRVIQELVKKYPNDSIITYSNTRIKGLLDYPVLQDISPPPRFLPQTIWDQFIFPHIVVPQRNKKYSPDIIHYTNNIVPFPIGEIPSVVTIHDMTPFVIPESYRYLHGAYQRAYFKYAAKHAAKIITVSENSLRDICRYLKVSDKKIVVAPLAVDDDFSKLFDEETFSLLLRRLGLQTPFILYAGAIHPRKNITRIINAFAALKVEKHIPHQLVIAGNFRWMSKQILAGSQFDKVADSVILSGHVTDAELVCLYSRCEAFVWPSLYEGFGLPILEAMDCGAPVVTSRCSAMTEVAGESALLVDPYNEHEISAAIWKIIDEPEFANKLSKRGKERVRLFSWEKTAEKVYQAYLSV